MREWELWITNEPTDKCRTGTKHTVAANKLALTVRERFHSLIPINLK